MNVISAGHKDFDCLFFSWFVTNWCNYDCSYCCNKTVLSPTFSKEHLVSNHKLVIARLSKLESQFIVDIEGGETTLHPHIREIVTLLCDIPNCKVVRLNTNLSRSLRFYQSLPEHPKLLLSASYHSEHHNDAFIEKCEALKARNFQVNVSMNDRPEYWPTILDLIEQLDNRGVRFKIDLLFSTPFRKVNYDSEMYQQFAEYCKQTTKRLYPFEFDDGSVRQLAPVEIREAGLHVMTGFQCTPMNYVIDFHGNIKNSCTGKRAPMIMKREFTHEAVVCTRPECNCDSMFDYPKERI